MTSIEFQQLQARLQELADEVSRRADSAAEQAQQPTGGEAAGDLSNTPLHLGDIGSEALTQELGATLMENEQYLQGEIVAALGRIKNGVFGQCENCGAEIARERLDAIPYARHCIACARTLHAGREVNLNEGRPRSWEEGIGLRADGPPPGAPGGPEESPVGSDPHAVGTPGGGSAIGGLAGTTIGKGSPDQADLEDAMGGGNFDIEVESQQAADEESQDEPSGGSSGPSGGAVGGTPANKRSSGGNRDGGR